MAPTLKEEYIFKVILLGESAVGKTSLLCRYTENVFQCRTTLVGQFSSHSLELDPDVCVKLNIWDTCGMERYRAVTRSSYRKAAGCLLVFDLTNQDSFNNINYWYDDISASTHASDEILFVLVGQKSDLPNRKVNREEAQQLADRWRCPYVETSALTGDNVKEVFDDLARRLKDRSDLRLDGHIDITEQATTKKERKCCP